jgi:anti-sigma factor RsiW
MKETQITAYALNELQGNERDEFESDLAADQKLQSELASASRVADGLAQAMNKPGEGLEPHAREKLLRAIAANQEALRAQRKVVRFAIPISLAAAASIAVLLWVTGGMTTHQPAMTAAERAGPTASGRTPASPRPPGSPSTQRVTCSSGTPRITGSGA